MSERKAATRTATGLRASPGAPPAKSAMATPAPRPTQGVERVAAFAGACFRCSVVHANELPAETGPEIAFVGRSNAGKSSAINRLVGQRRLAFASKLPGRTREINFFALPSGGHLVDLPGYGFARIPQQRQRAWSDAIEHYLLTRRALALIVLVMDIRHAPTASDLAFLAWLRAARRKSVPILALLTKADQLRASERMRRLHQAKAALASELQPGDSIIAFSSMSGEGLAQCDALLSRLLRNGDTNLAT
ncbi:MAG: ribosome biogenesis GTP-binding protein YihA/YsxC [Casimicrobiaceae bacterium]|nr:ribosome biogenesis GTP-binding protein YihA/YsxC [Casimicrobiaceae bacterium]